MEAVRLSQNSEHVEPRAGAVRRSVFDETEEEELRLTGSSDNPADTTFSSVHAASGIECSPWHRDYKTKMCGLQIPSVRDRVYTFLLHSSLNDLRAMGRETRTKHTGVKNTVICYLLCKAMKAVSSGEVEWDEFFGGRFRRFWANPSKISTPVRIAPSSEDIEAFATETLHRARRTASINAHEFARFVGILVENEEARSALLQSGMDLTRVEQKRRMSRDDFWETVVARLHNDREIIVGMNFIGLVDADDNQTALDLNMAVPQKRTGAWLKDKFFAVRASFTRAYHNWTRSGQNNPEGTDFEMFVPRAPASTAMSALGRHCMILFYAMKCGTEEEDVEVLNFTSKMVPFGAGYDDGEESAP